MQLPNEAFAHTRGSPCPSKEQVTTWWAADMTWATHHAKFQVPGGGASVKGESGEGKGTPRGRCGVEKQSVEFNWWTYLSDAPPPSSVLLQKAGIVNFELKVRSMAFSVCSPPAFAG